MGEWKEATLDSLGRIVTGKTPSSQLADCFGGNIPFVTPSDMAPLPEQCAIAHILGALDDKIELTGG